MAAVTAAVVTTAGAAYSANRQRAAAQDAANAQIQASEQGIAATQQAQNQLRQDLAPYAQFGASLLPQASALFGVAPQQQLLPAPQQAPQAQPQTNTEVARIQSEIARLQAEPGRTGPGGSMMNRIRQQQIQELTGQLNQLQVSQPAPQVAPQAGQPLPQQAGQQQFSADAGTQALVGSPLFQALLDENQRRILQNQAAGGRLSTGGVQQALQENALLTGYGLLGQERNALLNAITIGQNAAAQTGAGALQGGAQQANLLTGIGNVGAAQSIARGQASQGFAQSLGQGAGLLIGAYANRDPYGTQQFGYDFEGDPFA